ncbi:YopX family protein [Cytobacillus sp. FSL R7-0696]|uniref:YopX family protein n=1 Tax=Cytobacillus sp. FSL R7-0696 TaxID=2921691 RepID=UPI0030FBFAC4
MREIKFRAWDKSRKEKEYINNMYWFEENGVDDINNNVFLDFMQYTGLKDKNGKEIYEGDILAYKGLDGRNLNLVVKWSERDATFLFGGVRTDYAITGEVVGDIYENPDLINQES